MEYKNRPKPFWVVMIRMGRSKLSLPLRMLRLSLITAGRKRQRESIEGQQGGK
jgi:hypothetical protein